MSVSNVLSRKALCDVRRESLHLQVQGTVLVLCTGLYSRWLLPSSSSHKAPGCRAYTKQYSRKLIADGTLTLSPWPRRSSSSSACATTCLSLRTAWWASTRQITPPRQWPSIQTNSCCACRNPLLPHLLLLGARRMNNNQQGHSPWRLRSSCPSG